MSSDKNKFLKRFKVGGLPITHHFMEKARLGEILSAYLPPSGNEKHSAVDSLRLLIHNLVLGKSPVYELEAWVGSLDTRVIGYKEPPECFNDDRFGRALDRLQAADRASIMTELVVHVVKEFEIELGQVHNDSTSVKACGKYPAESDGGIKMRHGVSKDHRGDLKQLVYNLTVSADGAVPIHQKTYSGNRTDDTTHIETWDCSHSIFGEKDFLYVADSKLCTDKQLAPITGNGGRAITVMPRTWGEVKKFMERLRHGSIGRKEIWRRQKPGAVLGKLEYFSEFQGEFYSKQGYRVHWIYSSAKRTRDSSFRKAQLAKVEGELELLRTRINKRKLKTRESIEDAARGILKECHVEKFYDLEIKDVEEICEKKVGRGRPGGNSQYRRVKKVTYSLWWIKNKKALQREKRVDGVFPLLSTDGTLSAKEVIRAYKYQPMLEKRFAQFKSFHNAAPLLFKKVERVEGNMFAFFIALLIQSLIEREVRRAMKMSGVKTISVYPEDREASNPTTAKIMDVFEDVSTYQLCDESGCVEEYADDLNATQELILKLLNIDARAYWGK